MKQSTVEQKEEAYLKGLAARNPVILNEIYEHFFPGILKYIKEFGGNREDAEDVFQDALIVVYRQTKSGRLQLRSTFYTYLFAVCKKIWLNKSTKKSKQGQTLNSVPIQKSEDAEIEKTIEKTEKYRFFREKFKLLGKGCQQVLTLFFEGVNMKKIADLMGYASESYAKKRKFKCKKKLIEMIQEDNRFDEYQQ